MYNIQTLNKIAAVGTSKFDSSKYTVGDSVENPEAIMVRSAKMHDMEFEGVEKLVEFMKKFEKENA